MTDSQDGTAAISARYLVALASGVQRELGWGLRLVRREVEAWQRRARRISDPRARDLALRSLADKRSLTEGAARCWEVPPRRDERLLTCLVTFQILANYLDTFSEQHQRDHRTATSSVMRAFVDAVDTERPTGGYFLDHPGWDDDGYLEALVRATRSTLRTLPTYPRARGLLSRHATVARVLDLHHVRDPAERDSALEQFARTQIQDFRGLLWFEQAAAAASAMNVLVLLTLAADAACTDDDLEAAVDAYSYIGALSMMLDSFADQLDDAVSGHVSFIGYYASPSDVVQRMQFLIDRSLRDAARLRHGPRHVVLVAMMIAMFLSRDSARSPPLRDDTAALVAAGGTLTRRLVPVLRLWRVLSRLQGG